MSSEKDHFKDHVLQQKGENEWSFHQPDSSFYKMYFKVVETMNRIIILGDLGDWIFARNKPLDLFLRADNKDYFWEKISSSKNEYHPEKTRKAVEDFLREQSESDGEFADEDEEEKGIREEELGEKLKALKRLDLNEPQYAVSELESLGLTDTTYEHLVYTYPDRFEAVWKGIEAFRKKYWEIKNATS